MVVYQGTPPLSRYFLEHYGHKGQKWYHHIFGEVDSRAAYGNIKRETKKDIKAVRILQKAKKNYDNDSTSSATDRQNKYKEASNKVDKLLGNDAERRKNIEGFAFNKEEYGDVRTEAYKIREESKVARNFNRDIKKLSTSFDTANRKRRYSDAQAIKKQMDALVSNMETQIKGIQAYEDKDVAAERRQAAAITVRNVLTLGIGKKLSAWSGIGYPTASSARASRRARKSGMGRVMSE